MEVSVELPYRTPVHDVQSCPYRTPVHDEDLEQFMNKFDNVPRRSIRAAEHLSLKHALPATFLKHALLLDNPCQSRLLQVESEKIRKTRINYNSSFETARSSFINTQNGKQRKWRFQDELRTTSMNMPSLTASAERSQVDVLYNSPYYEEIDTATTRTLLPYMTIRPEKTQFVAIQDKISITKLPEIIEVDGTKLHRYNTYCGQTFAQLVNLKVVEDKRMQSLTKSLGQNLSVQGQGQGQGQPKPKWKKRQKRDLRMTRNLVSPDSDDPWFMDEQVDDGESDEESDHRGTYAMPTFHQRNASNPGYVHLQSLAIQRSQTMPVLGQERTEISGKMPELVKAGTHVNLSESTVRDPYDAHESRVKEAVNNKEIGESEEDDPTGPTTTENLKKKVTIPLNPVLTSIFKDKTFISKGPFKAGSSSKVQELERELLKIRMKTVLGVTTDTEEKNIEETQQRRRKKSSRRSTKTDDTRKSANGRTGDRNDTQNRGETSFTTVSRNKSNIKKDLKYKDFKNLKKTYGKFRQMYSQNEDNTRDRGLHQKTRPHPYPQQGLKYFSDERGGDHPPPPTPFSCPSPLSVKGVQVGS